MEDSALQSPTITHQNATEAKNGSLRCTAGGLEGGTHMQHHCRLKCASQSGIMLMVELPSGHQTVSTLMELFMADLGSQCVGSRIEHVNSGKPFATL